MALSVSAAVLLGVIVAVLVEGGCVRVGSLFGFTFAVTGLALAISSGLASLTGRVSSL